jgi:UDP-N-acetylenolpyruvoylglucosamine reductase
MDFDKIFNDINQLDVGDILRNEPLYKHTTFKVGGPASLYVQVKDTASLIKIINYIKINNINYFVLGKGSNVLFSDQQFKGIVLSLSKYFTKIEIEETVVRAQAGVYMIKLAKSVCKNSLKGLEFISGIPGSLGGGVYMNAGAYNLELSEFIKEVTFLDEGLNIKTLGKEELAFSYRSSIFQSQENWVVLEVVLQLSKGNKAEITDLINQRKQRRLETQPCNEPSAGSVFKNPKDKSAWQYIDQCGLRGKMIGGAQVSLKHPNFIVNNQYASAKDILDLIEYVRATVYKKYDVLLHTEIKLINW